MAELRPQLADFTWQDPFLLENQLSEDDRMLRDAATQFAQKELQPLIIEAYRDAHVSPELFPKMGEAGLLGATIPDLTMSKAQPCVRKMCRGKLVSK